MANLNLDLDPKKIIKSLKEVEANTKELAETIDSSLGKDATKAIDKLEKTAEGGSNKIRSYFRNLGTQIKEDLKAAFDFGKVLSGVKMGQEISQGIGQILDMEKAFARLNTRLMLSGDGLKDFKKNIGNIVAGNAQKLEDILPGVEAAASKGNIKDVKQLNQIADVLSKSRALTGEDVGSLGEEAVDILKLQGEKVSASTISKTIDALNAARTSGAFSSTSEAAGAVKELAPYAKQLGLDTRSASGLAAIASKAGDSGQNILRQILEKGTTVGGQQQLNAVLGQNIFKGGKLNPEALGKIDVNRFGNQAILEEASGLTGANGQELKLFIDAFKGAMPEFQKVVNGSDETAKQFEIATNNVGSSIDRFKQRIINSSRSIGESILSAGDNILKGNFKGAGKDASDIGSTLKDNAGVLAGGAALTIGAGMLAGKGLKNLFGSMGGGAVGGLVKGKALEQAGVQPVYVTNASEIGGGGILSSAGDLAKKGGGIGGVLSAISKALPTALKIGGATTAVYAALRSEGAGQGEDDEVKKMYEEARAQRAAMGGDSPESIKQAVMEGAKEGLKQAKEGTPTTYTNPSAYPSTGRSM